MEKSKLRGLGLFMFLASFMISLIIIPKFVGITPKHGGLPGQRQIPQTNTVELTASEKTNKIPKINKLSNPKSAVIKSDKPASAKSNTPKPEIKKQEVIPVTKKTTPKKSVAASIQPQVFIYHTHNRESWLPELKGKTSADQAFDPKINVTLLGNDLANKLTEKGMKVLHTTDDYPSAVKNFNYAKSYVYSKATLTQELSKHKSIEYVFDIHRDSEAKNQTTITYHNQNYAQLYFVVGRENPNWKETMEFATRLENKLNKEIPGISKGIYQKDHSSGNGKYNQSLAEYSALIEIGGVDNVLEENYRTISILADAIHEIWHEDHGSTVS